MPAQGGDPYQTLGLRPGVSDDELRSAYRRLVQLHHPDHNGGSGDSTRRFEEVQDAYAQIRELRGAKPRAEETHRTTVDPDVESRLADLERELRAAYSAREQARRAARQEAVDREERPSDEELGYVRTEDSFSKILADARSELADRFSGAQEHPVVTRVGDLIDDLDELVSKLNRKPPKPG